MVEKKETEAKQTTNNGFDTRAFMRQCFVPREGEVAVPALKDYFPDGGEAVWKVRGLTADELSKSEEAGERYKKIGALVEAMTSEKTPDVVDGMKKWLGTSSDTSTNVVKRRQHLIFGSVNPAITEEVALKISEAFPIEFYDITNNISELTGLGQIAGKSKPSGKEQTLSPASNSRT